MFLGTACAPAKSGRDTLQQVIYSVFRDLSSAIRRFWLKFFFLPSVFSFSVQSAASHACRSLGRRDRYSERALIRKKGYSLYTCSAHGNTADPCFRCITGIFEAPMQEPRCIVKMITFTNSACFRSNSTVPPSRLRVLFSERKRA